MAVIPKRFYSEAEFEEYSGIKRKTLQYWRVVGKGPRFRKLCGSVKYDIEDIEDWVSKSPAGGAGHRVESR